MTGHPPDERCDDRAHDQDLDRLRDAAAHVIDIVRTSVRGQLDAGIHPVDALTSGLAMLEQWQAAMDRASPMPPVTYTRHIEGLLTRLQERIGPERMWDWVREPHPGLRAGQSPLHALVGHDAPAVAALIDALPARPPPEAAS